MSAIQDLSTSTAQTSPPQVGRGAVPEQMDALVLRGPGRFGVERTSVPRPGDDEVLCRVDSVAICGTDPHIIAGEFPNFWPRTYPFVPGHEWAGTVVSAGARAASFGWASGQRVAGSSHVGCGYCRACRTGRYNLCEAYGDEARGHRQYGHYSPGAYAEYVIQSIRSVFRVPDSLSLEEAALLDPASIALHAVERADPAPGDTVVVVGPGPIGLMAVSCALAIGAGRVLVVGRGARLKRAVELGGEPIEVDVGGGHVATVLDRTRGLGAPAVVECAGTIEALQQAIAMAGRGGRVAAVGLPSGEEGDSVPLPVRRMVLDEIELRGVRANRNTCEEVLPLLASGRVPAGRLITHRFPLRDFAEALDTFVTRRAGAIKVLVKP
jgi:L-iditol 2-dehydrogenase